MKREAPRPLCLRAQIAYTTQIKPPATAIRPAGPPEEQAERSETTAQRLWKQPLYWHQWEALRTVIEKHRSIVVATGTGSGKTECYLLPLLYMLITEDPSVRAQSGVRAILLFPMNALVEDQMRRLRKLLFWVNLASSTLPPSAPEKLRRQVTFGRYTGDTPVDEADRERSRPTTSGSSGRKSLEPTCSRNRLIFW